MAPWGVGVKAAQEPRPAKGFRDTPSTVTATSFRGHSMRTTPFFGVASVPAALAIRCASSLVSCWARANAPALRMMTTAAPPETTLLIPEFIGGFPFALLAFVVLPTQE